jgi:hypothetical protein
MVESTCIYPCEMMSGSNVGGGESSGCPSLPRTVLRALSSRLQVLEPARNVLQEVMEDHLLSPGLPRLRISKHIQAAKVRLAHMASAPGRGSKSCDANLGCFRAVRAD